MRFTAPENLVATRPDEACIKRVFQAEFVAEGDEELAFRQIEDVGLIG